MTPEFLIDRCLGQKFPSTLEGAGSFAQLAQGLIALQPAIARFIARHPRPFMAKVYCPGADDGRGNMKGRISLYVQDR